MVQISWSTPKTWSSGAAVTAAEMNTELRDNLNDIEARLQTHGIDSSSTPQLVLSARYGCSASLSDETASDQTDTRIQFAEADEEWKDASGMHTDANPARFIALITGTYQFTGWTRFQANATGRRECWIEKNQTTAYQRVRVPSAGSGAVTAIQTIIELEMTAGDYCMLYVRHNAGTTLDIAARMQMRLVGV